MPKSSTRNIVIVTIVRPEAHKAVSRSRHRRSGRDNSCLDTLVGHGAESSPDTHPRLVDVLFVAERATLHHRWHSFATTALQSS